MYTDAGRNRIHNVTKPIFWAFFYSSSPFSYLNAQRPFTYYVSTFLELLDPFPSIHSYIFSTESKKNCNILTPLPPTIAYVIYEWSLTASDHI